MWQAPGVRRALFVVALALLLVLDVAIVPLALAILLPGGRSGQSPEWLRGSFFFLLVLSVLGWLTAAVVTQLRRSMRQASGDVT